ncbi:MAG: GNAT family N-acetyltransferase [Spirosomaceae bacterium]|nr:GNAT family N-acetyltransferase [Spirosomataceae bacterium]
MTIQNSVPADLPTILALYENARQHQREQQTVVIWPEFDVEIIKKEIEENHQWKIVINGQIACVWATTLNDKAIWEEKDRDDGVYIHRIATNPDFRGNHFVKRIVEWAIQYTKDNGRKYVRLDTLGRNTRLVEHYTKSGFDYLGEFKLANTASLPLHYQTEPICLLFEIEVG